MFWRKGDLSLSINAIVVLILAITILGLGLGFIRSQFKTMTGEFDRVSGDIKQSIIDDIQSSGELLAFKTVSLEVQKGVQGEFYFGIMNPNTEDRCYQVAFKCIKALSGVGCNATGGGLIVVGGSVPPVYNPEPRDATKFTSTSKSKWFTTFTNVTIPGGSTGVYLAQYQISGVSDTYLMEVDAFQSALSQTKCSGAPATVWSESTQWWQSKQFYVKVK
ncbi:MAG: hypothetical protein V1837_00470 [Candidatus Woesearchaeota archaeon]